MTFNAFFAWTGGEDWNETGRKVQAQTEREAAAQFARDVLNLDEDDEGVLETLEVRVCPADRPHRPPSRWSVQVKVEVRTYNESVATASRILTI